MRRGASVPDQSPTLEAAVVGQFEPRGECSRKTAGILDKIATCEPCGSRLWVVASPFQPWFSAPV